MKYLIWSLCILLNINFSYASDSEKDNQGVRPVINPVFYDDELSQWQKELSDFAQSTKENFSKFAQSLRPFFADFEVADEPLIINQPSGAQGKVRSKEEKMKDGVLTLQDMIDHDGGLQVIKIFGKYVEENSKIDLMDYADTLREVFIYDYTFSRNSFTAFIQQLESFKQLRTLDLSGCIYPFELLVEALQSSKFPILDYLTLQGIPYEDDSITTVLHLNEIIKTFAFGRITTHKVLALSPSDKDDVLMNSLLFGLVLGNLRLYYDCYQPEDFSLSIVFKQQLTLPAGFNSPDLLVLGVSYPKDMKTIESPDLLKMISALRNGEEFELTYGDKIIRFNEK